MSFDALFNSKEDFSIDILANGLSTAGMRFGTLADTLRQRKNHATIKEVRAQMNYLRGEVGRLEVASRYLFRVVGKPVKLKKAQSMNFRQKNIAANYCTKYKSEASDHDYGATKVIFPAGTVGIVSSTMDTLGGYLFRVAIPDPVTGKVGGRAMSLQEDQLNFDLSPEELKAAHPHLESLIVYQEDDNLKALEKITKAKQVL